jgi:HD-like signal output (HDOD) protein
MTAALTPEVLVRRAASIASFPAIFEQVSRTIDRSGSSAGDIGRVLSTDQGLAARLLRVANSSFYGFPSRVDSIDQAVLIIGTRQLRDLIIATVVLNQFRGIDAKLVDMASFWRHGLACGLAARAIARLRREPNTERFFIAGLLHDIGSLVLYQQLPRVLEELLTEHASNGELLETLERTRLGFDHSDVGDALLEAWRLPAAIRKVAADHHRFSPQSPYAIETAAIHVSDILVGALELGTSGERCVPRFHPSAWELLGLSTSHLEEIVEEVVQTLSGIEQVFTGGAPR